MASEIRASDLEDGDIYWEDGDSAPTTITSTEMHGDTVLIWGVCDGSDIHTTLDRDTVVSLIGRKAKT